MKSQPLQMSMRVRGPLRSLALAALAAASVAFGHAEAQKPRQAQIDKNGVIILIRSTLTALDQADKTGNYTVLRDLAAPGFAAANTSARLAEIFANLRRDKVDLSGVLVLEPQLTVLPEIGENGMMRLAGFFPSAPLQVNFEFLFAPVDGQWRLFGIATNLGSSQPAAPPPPEAKKPEPKKPEAKAPASHRTPERAPAPAAGPGQ